MWKLFVLMSLPFSIGKPVLGAAVEAVPSLAMEQIQIWWRETQHNRNELSFVNEFVWKCCARL
jgi:hypothetical protein